MQIGHLGELFASLLLAAAGVSSISFFIADRQQNNEKAAWEKLAVTTWWIHALSVFGVILTLFYLIYSHDYRYHYVWEHSSNELPVYYMISCYWEGQEGSFLLWIFWHTILGSILLRKYNEWRNLILSVVSSIQVILGTMILGAYIPQTSVTAFFCLTVLSIVAVFALQWRKTFVLALATNSGTVSGYSEASPKQNFHLSSIILGLLLCLMTYRQLNGFWEYWTWNDLGRTSGFAFGLFLLMWVAYTVYYFVLSTSKKLNTTEIFSGMALIILGFLTIYVPLTAWKLGSTPFMLLKDALPDAPVFKNNPDFVPTNGTGLNPLLQNYWMVIHPPTLFLGFASTIVPFAFVVAGLIKNKYDQWINPARPWLLFSIMILGIGIIMGGYWAYETLNFGGYWNWDPVENASLVPWLTAIASLHALLIYQKSQNYLKLAMGMIVATFILVLYSTFLTRSGILGETSVHTFTDLGLSGQLLVLVFLYLIPLVLTFAKRWNAIPHNNNQPKSNTSEFFLFLGTLIFIFAAAEISFSTSLPVFNKIFGTHAAPPSQIQLFYYKWNIWFAIGFGIFSAIGQFLWWKRNNNKSVADALFRPFLFAIVIASLTIAILAYSGRPFAYHDTTAKLWAEGGIANYIEVAFLIFADEILLLSSLFALAANFDILIGVLRKNTKGIKAMGGAITHIGFALMLLGILASSGYDRVISKNLMPSELSLFKGDDKNDNVLLPVRQPRQIDGYWVTYLGKKQALPPLHNFYIIEVRDNDFKVKFEDKTGETFAMDLPKNVFSQQEHDQQSSKDTPINLQFVKDFTEKNLSYLQPNLINNRTKFQIKFADLKDSTKSFNLVPESEVNQEMNSILSHPSRKIFWNKDLYVHVSSIPNPKETESKPQYFNFTMKPGQTERAGRFIVNLEKIVNLSEQAEKDNLILAAGAIVNVQVQDSAATTPNADAKNYLAQPVYTIDKSQKPGMIESDIPVLGVKFAFVGINPKEQSISLQMEYTPNSDDWIVIKAIEKPYINLLWIGTFILSIGFAISIYNRKNRT